ncbi:MAG TPA: decarboxylating 6-phosphogluconate dehydrogenase [Rhizomicrobium sp.]|jgi:6-phosphogluconate dehydrogenase|nr:decarboxylating 6-phosphogluconate dehydrogenase [Rhizomicrobium sp.]
MQIAIIGLGRMGGNIARRLMEHSHEVVAYDRSADAVRKLANAKGAGSLDDVARLLTPPRTAWVMLPAGTPTEETIEQLGKLFDKGDTVIDGGNTFYRDDIRRAARLAPKGINYVDVGTSGGIWGYDRGYCMMIGGDKDVVDRLDPIFSALAPGLGTISRTPKREDRDPRPEQGYVHAGPPGAGHFVKMIHNGIEYGLMQAYAEGFGILRGKASEFLPEAERYRLNLPDIAEVWRRGSVISSWLLDLAAIAFADDPELSEFSGFVDDSGEGRWTINAAIEEAVPANVLSAALYARFRSRISSGFADKLLSALRAQFGGHVEGQLEKAAQAERKS